MEIQQEDSPFKPINIKFEKRAEAKAFFDLIDKIESFRCNADSGITSDSFSNCEEDLIIKLSNARTNQNVII